MADQSSFHSLVFHVAESVKHERFAETLSVEVGVHPDWLKQPDFVDGVEPGLGESGELPVKCGDHQLVTWLVAGLQHDFLLVFLGGPV